MNLHVLPDSKFSNAFAQNLSEIGALSNNKLVVRTNEKALKHVKGDVGFARLYSSQFERITGETSAYDRVYIHQLHPLMYKWVVRHQFKELNWMFWGTDLYNLPFLDDQFLGQETRHFNRQKSLSEWLYLAKFYATNFRFRNEAYSKVNHVLTWMKTEYDYAGKNLPSLNAKHEFFFYENEMPYHQLDNAAEPPAALKSNFNIIVGNSGTPTNNHIEAVRKIWESRIQADLYLPLSYGDHAYVARLKRSLDFYDSGKIHFMENFMPFGEYLKFLSTADALVMNHLRPQGYGNIFMMMYLGKPVFLNPGNLSLPDLTRAGFRWRALEEITRLGDIQRDDNATVVNNFLSHDKLVQIYKNLFL